jgi:cell division protein FtsN
MNVIAITILISMALGGIFIVCFAAEAFKKKKSSPERDSLLPLQDDSNK